jgi:SAM-dependent methyltransferase
MGVRTRPRTLPRMDAATIRSYDADAAAYATDWEDGQAAPDDLRAVVAQWFGPGPTADVGCGSGRDTAWLDAHGYPATGYDASAGLLAEARRRHPGVRFEEAVLPELHGVPAAAFANVLCETVIMHLDAPLVAASVRRMLDLLRPAGTLYLSWRVTSGSDQRDAAGRLYAVVDLARVRDTVTGSGAAMIVHDEERTSASSGKVIHRIVARRAG